MPATERSAKHNTTTSKERMMLVTHPVLPRLTDDQIIIVLDASLFTDPNAVLIYARLSEDAVDDQLGIQRQVGETWEWMEKLGRPVAAIVVDNDISATSGEFRDGFEKIVAREFGVCEVATWHIDRFLRISEDLEKTIKQDLVVHALHSGFLDLSTPAGKAVARTLTAWNTYEGEQKALRQKAAHRQRVGLGRPFLGGARPFGFDKDPVNHTYIVRPEEAEALKGAYTLLLAGAKLTAIAKYMNETGQFPDRRKKRKRGTELTSGKWNFNSIRQVLVQPRNAGIITYNKTEAGKGNWTPIVTEEVFRAATTILRLPSRRSPGPRKGASHVEHLLTSLITCSECGSRTQIKWRESPKEGRYRIYQCRNGCASARAEHLENRISALIINRVENPVNEKSESDKPDAIKLHEDVARYRLKGEHYAHMLDADEMDFDQFTLLNKKNLDRIASIERELAKLALGAQLAELIDVDDIAHHWVENMTVQHRNSLTRSYIEKIVIHPRGKGVGKWGQAVAQYRLIGDDTWYDVD